MSGDARRRGTGGCLRGQEGGSYSPATSNRRRWFTGGRLCVHKDEPSRSLEAGEAGPEGRNEGAPLFVRKTKTCSVHRRRWSVTPSHSVSRAHSVTIPNSPTTSKRTLQPSTARDRRNSSAGDGDLPISEGERPIDDNGARIWKNARTHPPKPPRPAMRSIVAPAITASRAARSSMRSTAAASCRSDSRIPPPGRRHLSNQRETTEIPDRDPLCSCRTDARAM